MYADLGGLHMNHMKNTKLTNQLKIKPMNGLLLHNVSAYVHLHSVRMQAVIKKTHISYRKYLKKSNNSEILTT